MDGQFKKIALKIHRQVFPDPTEITTNQSWTRAKGCDSGMQRLKIYLQNISPQYVTILLEQITLGCQDLISVQMNSLN